MEHGGYYCDASIANINTYLKLSLPTISPLWAIVLDCTAGSEKATADRPSRQWTIKFPVIPVTNETPTCTGSPCF